MHSVLAIYSHATKPRRGTPIYAQRSLASHGETRLRSPAALSDTGSPVYKLARLSRRLSDGPGWDHLSLLMPLRLRLCTTTTRKRKQRSTTDRGLEDKVYDLGLRTTLEMNTMRILRDSHP